MWPGSVGVVDPNIEGITEKPQRSPADAWAMGPDGSGSGSQSALGGEATYKFWDGSTPLLVQLPGNLPIETLVAYSATIENVNVYAGSGVSSGPPLFSTSGAAGTFRIPGSHTQLTLVASAAFIEGPIPLFFSNEKMPPTVALQEVNVVVNSGVPAGATPCASQGMVGLTGPGTTNLSFLPAVPIGPYAVAITYADIAFDAPLTSPNALMLQQNVASFLFPLMVLVAGFNARTYSIGNGAIAYASAILQNASIKAIGAGFPAGELYWNVQGYFKKLTS